MVLCINPAAPTHESAAKSFELQVQQGLIKGYSTIDIFGINPSVTTASDPEDLWEGGGEYPFSTSADIVSISSSDDTDTQDVIIKGLDAAGSYTEQTVTLQGQTRVTLDTVLWRIQSAANEGSTAFSGMIYIYSGTEETDGVPSGSSVIKALINDGNNRTLSAIYTVPKGKVGFLYKGEVGLECGNGSPRAEDFACLLYKSRRYGKVFQIKKHLSIQVSGSSVFQDYRSFPDIIPALTDIKLTVNKVSDTIGCWGTLDIMLVDDSLFSAEYLLAIGQPS